MELYKGEQHILYISIDGEFVPVGCLTDNTFNENLSTLVTTSKIKDGWTTSRGSSQEYSITFNGLSNSSYVLSKLSFLKRTKTLIEWRIDYFTVLETGFGYIMDLQESATVDEIITFNGTLQGYGEPFVYDDDLYLNYELNFDI